MESLGGQRIAEIMQIADKAERSHAESALRDDLIGRIVPGLVEAAVEAGEPAASATALATKQTKATHSVLCPRPLVRSRIVSEGARIDGRGAQGSTSAVGRGVGPAHGARHRSVPAWRDPGAQRVRRSAWPRWTR
ncbi:MAG: hypothetical protein V9E94_06640 [Microthrixaceae bacterium]